MPEDSLLPSPSDTEGASLQKINQLTWDIAAATTVASAAGLAVALLSRSSFAGQPSGQQIEIESVALSGNGLFALAGSNGISLARKCLVQISAWIQLADSGDSTKTLLIQLDTTAVPGGGLFTLASAAIRSNVASASIAALVDVGAIIRTLIMTDVSATINYGTFTILASPIA